jgi:hypothetical protein
MRGATAGRGHFDDGRTPIERFFGDGKAEVKREEGVR